ncbi:hypothetical protein RhiirA5_382331 [Rhizophagus irregularis]|uniref:Uncharacterized protein n=1 Tax=Rhizophagus irregularis TaxID=588596 RepID=A0A2N0P1B1_9GLOM|nr:hypothetical protein RhiirA5_382331 [Rhizophagus irregularis]
MEPEQEAVETPELRRKRLAKERQAHFRKRQMIKSDAVSFRKNIRRYNNVLACTSFGASIDIIPGQDLIKTNVPDEIFMIIHGDRTRDSHRYNAPTASEVATIMVGDGHELYIANRDILLQMHDGGLQRILEIHPSYDPLHYILLFPRGDDGWHVDVPLIGAKKKERVTTMQFYSYRLQIRDGD